MNPVYKKMSEHKKMYMEKKEVINQMIAFLKELDDAYFRDYTELCEKEVEEAREESLRYGKPNC